MKNNYRTILTYAGKREYTRKDGSTGYQECWLDDNSRIMEMNAVGGVPYDKGTTCGCVIARYKHWDKEANRFVEQSYIESLKPVVED